MNETKRTITRLSVYYLLRLVNVFFLPISLDNIKNKYEKV